MLTHEQNELLTRTGPGTPMGDMLRRYWIPAMLAEELPENDCPPVRIKLLSERLLAWRDTQGRYALTDEFCAHRGVSLWFGRNEDGGLRCPYHGWKYDHTGQCIDVPSEPVESGFCKKIKLKSYPLIKRGGLLWAYMGPPELQPADPAFEWAELPDSHCFHTKRWQECNWLQAMEGGIDSSHVSLLHSGDMHRDPLHRNTKGAHYQARPEAEIRDDRKSQGGLFIGARRNAEEGHYYWRITPVDHALVHHRSALWRQRAQRACLGADRRRELLHLDLHLSPDPAALRNGARRHAQGRRHPCRIRPRHVPPGDQQGQRLHDGSAAQKEGRTYSGVKGIAMQDASIQESMGPIVDRTKENLVSTDNAIIMARQRLRRAALALQERAHHRPVSRPTSTACARRPSCCRSTCRSRRPSART